MPVPASAQGLGKYELKTLGTWGGSLNAVQVEGDLAYVAAGRQLVILNISDLTNPTEVGSIDLENLVMDVAVRDGRAYVCTYSRPNYFCVLDVSDPASARLLWSFQDKPNFKAKQVTFYGDLAYVRDRYDLDAFDFTDADNPVWHTNIIESIVADTTIVGDLMYMVTNSQQVRIYDLSDPLNPLLRGQVTLPGTDYDGTAIAVEGQYAYATTMREGGVFAIVDISDPEAPFVVGYYDDFLNARDVAVSNGFAYVADWEDGASPYGWERIGLKIFDVADPSNPTLVNTYKTHGTVSGVEVFGSTAYVFDEGEGLIVLDVSDPTNPVRLGNYYSPAELRKMAKVGNLLYVSDEWNGMTILDVSDGANPTLVGVYQTPQDGYHMAHWGLEVRDGVAYLSAGYGQLQAVDVTDPANPALLGVGEFMHEYGTYCFGLGLWGDVASLGFHVPGDESRFVNFDVSDPQNIVHIGDVVANAPLTIDTTPEGIAFCTRDGGGGGWLMNVDTSDPTDPFVIYNGWRGGIDLARDGNLLYVANGDSDEAIGGLYIMNVSDPANPIELSHFPARFGRAVAVHSDYAYVVAGDPDNGFISTLFLLEVSDPAAPTVLTKRILDGGKTRALLADGPDVYRTAEGSGLVIFELSVSGDLNGDGCVDQADLGILLADWGCTGGDCPGDGDGDGDTDQADLGILLAHWGEGCP